MSIWPYLLSGAGGALIATLVQATAEAWQNRRSEVRRGQREILKRIDVLEKAAAIVEALAEHERDERRER